MLVSMDRRGRLVLFTFALSISGLFLEQAEPSPSLSAALHVLDFTVLGLILWEAAAGVAGAAYKWNHVRKNAPSLLFVLGFTVLFAYTKYQAFSGIPASARGLLPQLLRNGFLALKIAGRVRRLSAFAEKFSVHPAQTIVASFLLVILTGSLLLMMPPATPDRAGLDFLDAVFTATSAVCVTGLVVADTAVDLAVPGQLVVLALIQIGGLGIMAYSFFGLFALGRKVSIRDRLTVSYMLSEDDLRGLSASLRRIVLYTFAIEGLGAAAFYLRFSALGGHGWESAFRALFHAVSAFCNAGFALFSDSLESFRSDAWITLTAAALIVLGGISFGVIRDGLRSAGAALGALFGRRPAALPAPSQNTRAVVSITLVLLASGLAGFYLLEHEGAMASYGLGEQYLAAFFQSVTLRTAGFNTVPFGALRDSTLLFMIVFMFIGGASGSTAGGIKVNSLAAIGAYFSSFFRRERTPRIGGWSVAPEKVGRSLLVLAFGLSAVFLGVFFLTLTEGGDFLPLLFETVSAFGTVGLSTGLTSGLSSPGKIVIIALMFLGRLGPLTILSAARRPGRRTEVQYPEGDLAVG